ncbi:MAG: hypothetical protein EHM24_21745, partial [Acidobacteria bacterium]
MAAGGRPAHADEQPRSRGGRAPRRPDRLRRVGQGRAELGVLRGDHRCAAVTRGRRDAARAVGQAGRHLPDPPRRAPRGSSLSCKNWLIEAAYRMIQNNLDPEVAEKPDALVVYHGIGKAARNHDALRAIVRALLELGEDETLLVQSGKPVGVFTTHPGAPRVLIANSLLVPRWATWDEFRRLEAEGLTMFGQM